MKFLLAKNNIFAVILLMIVLLSFVKLDKTWVRGESSAQSVCTNCEIQEATDVPVISFTPTRIVMEKAGIDLPVVSVPIENGTWEVHPGVANYAEGTSLINEKRGNAGIFGHALPDVFLNIKKLSVGDSVIVYGQNYKALYEVQTSDKVLPSSVEAFYPEENPVLTLITCDGVFDQNRYRVRAMLIRIEEI